MIDVSPLGKALDTLDEALAVFAASPEDKLIRDACIQRFEYSFELSHKMLRRYLEATEGSDVTRLSFPALIRLGFERGLLTESWDVWIKFRDARNITSHGYDEAKAKKVAAILVDFASEARGLFNALASRPAE